MKCLITQFACNIYSIWCKCFFEKLNYSNINLKSFIEYKLKVYLEVFLSVMHDFAQKKTLEKCADFYFAYL